MVVSLSKRLLTMLDDEYMTDVVFDVQGQQFKCHKLILSSCETRLKEMVAKSPQVKVDDVAPHTFQAILKLLYSDDCGTTDSNVFELMHAAKTYEIGDLESSCSEFIRDKLSETNVSFFTSQALHFDAKDSLKVCLDFFKQNTLEVLDTEQFLDIPLEVLETFCENKSDKCSESRFFVACFFWAKAKCKRQNLEEKRENFHEVLGEKLIDWIKYEKMKMQEFLTIVTDSNLFELMHAARIFEIGDLERSCSEFIHDKKLSKTNVGYFTSQALHFDAKDSLKACLDFFKQNTLKVLDTQQFLDIPREVLQVFLENKSDNCSDSRFFTACFNWAKAECKRKKLEEKHENFREVLGEKLINRIKYDDIGMAEFLNIVVSADVLTPEEIGRHIITLQKKNKFQVNVKDHYGRLTPLNCPGDTTIKDIKGKRIWDEGKQSYEADLFTLSHKGKRLDDEMTLRDVDPSVWDLCLELEVDTFKITLHDCKQNVQKPFVLQVKDLPDPRLAIHRECYPGCPKPKDVLLGNSDNFGHNGVYYISEKDPPKSFHPGKIIYHRFIRSRPRSQLF